jgi:hypothetical protein
MEKTTARKLRDMVYGFLLEIPDLSHQRRSDLCLWDLIVVPPFFALESTPKTMKDPRTHYATNLGLAVPHYLVENYMSLEIVCELSQMLYEKGFPYIGHPLDLQPFLFHGPLTLHPSTRLADFLRRLTVCWTT